MLNEMNGFIALVKSRFSESQVNQLESVVTSSCINIFESMYLA